MKRVVMLAGIIAAGALAACDSAATPPAGPSQSAAARAEAAHAEAGHSAGGTLTPWSPPAGATAQPQPSRHPRASAANRPEPTPNTPRSRTATHSATPVSRYAVLRVVDGDTVHVAYHGDTTVRVIGIDAPETVSPSVPDECGGQAASAAARQLLSGKKVQLVFDASQGRHDKYGRTLAYLQVPGVGDFGLKMIKLGHAAEYTYDTPYARQARYRAVEAEARAAGRGLWGKCGGPNKPLHTPTPTHRSSPTHPPVVKKPASNCEPGYSPCLPVVGDLDCGEIPASKKPIHVTGSDRYRLDRDGDGYGCEP